MMYWHDLQDSVDGLADVMFDALRLLPSAQTIKYQELKAQHRIHMDIYNTNMQYEEYRRRGAPLIRYYYYGGRGSHKVTKMLQTM
jgi:hypothetical protein